VTGHQHPGGLEKLNEMRMLSGLKSIAALLRQHGEARWADWFDGDRRDYLAAGDPGPNIARQIAVIEHILAAFGGVSDFNRLVLEDDSGTANDTLRQLAEQIWLGARGVQAHLYTQVQRR